MRVSYSVQTARGTSKPVEPCNLANACLRGISVAEAEQVLAKVWQRIEEHGTEAPSLQFGFGRDGCIDIAFSFSNMAVAALILDGLTSPCPPLLRHEIVQTGPGHGGCVGAAGLDARRLGSAD